MNDLEAQMDKICDIKIRTKSCHYEFTGWYLPECQTENWHYYKTTSGWIYHIKKSELLDVISRVHDEDER